MSENVILIGAGGHGKVIADIVMRAGAHVMGFLDDAPASDSVLGIPVLGPVSSWPQYCHNASFVLAIGANGVRRRLAGEMDVSWFTAIHPSAQIGREAVIGPGTVIMANAVVNPQARIGAHCIVNTGAIVEHDNVIGDFVHLSPGAVLCGTVHVGEETHIGAGAVLKNNIRVCAGVVIGAGGVVIHDIETPGTYVGVPVRLLP